MKNVLRFLWKVLKVLLTPQVEVPAKGKPKYDVPLFTNKALRKMKYLGISEYSVNDVFFHGTVIKENMMARKYNGYEIGIVYDRDKRTGQYIIFSVWKRSRR